MDANKYLFPCTQKVYEVINLEMRTMYKNYLKIAWRNLIKNKLFALINISGLTIGMTCFILIALYIQFELSFDAHHEKSDSIYRIAQQQNGNEYSGNNMFALAPLPLGEALLSDFPEVTGATNLNVNGAILINDTQSYFERGLFTDNAIFEVFTIPVVRGKGKEALNKPGSILLTESLALKIFGDANSLGRQLKFNNKEELTVEGIISDPPKNQHFTYSYIVSNKISGFYEDDVNNWASNNYHTYITLAEGYDYKDLIHKMEVYEEITKPVYQSEGFHFYPEFTLQSLKDIHLFSNMNSELAVNGDIQQLYLFLCIAFIILILASINYMNLTTAKSAQRAKEVGVSKVLGARREQLTMQFLGESFLLTIFSFCIALALAGILLPAFNELLDKSILFTFARSWWALLAMLFIALLVGGLSGLYPAIFLSRVNPVKALKGNFLRSHKDGAILRNSLVVGQFVVAIALAIGGLVISEQLHFIESKKLGYNKQQVVHVPYGGQEISMKEDVIKDELLKHPRIQKVSNSTQLPLGITSNGPVRTWEGNQDNQELFLYRAYVDHDFIDLFEMKLVEGRNFSRERPSDSTAYILNESAVKALGWKNAVGKEFNDGRVIGVLEDFHLQTFNRPIAPLFMILRDEFFSRNFGQVILKVDMEDYEQTRAFIEKTLTAEVPLSPYDVRFMEDSYAQLYDNETRLGKAFNIFTFLALFIAAMGLFGLVSFHVYQRTKEIGIRKVLGSSASEIVRLLAKDFLKLIVFALMIAAPIAYFAMDNWLEAYAYRIDIEWWIFVLVGLSATAIALITISFQSLKAALANPVKSLRTE